MRHYIGHDGFIWWIGIVESTDDPLELGRCKVRCFGYHPGRKEELVPPEDLPWAMTLMPANLQNFYGRPNAGDWVVGFFLDSDLAQEPVILGILPAKPAKPDAKEKYFGMHPRFANTFTKIKNDETPNRNQLINTSHSLINTVTKQLVTLPEDGVYLSNSAIESVKTLIDTSELDSNETFAFYHKNGSKIEISDYYNLQKQLVNRAIFRLFNNSYVELRKEVLNEKGDTTDYALINHESSGSQIEMKTNVASGITTNTLTLSSSTAELEIKETSDGTTINITHPKGTKIEIDSSGEITITSNEKINLTSAKDVFVSGTGGTYSLTEKIKSMDIQIEVAKTLPEPPPPP